MSGQDWMEVELLFRKGRPGGSFKWVATHQIAGIGNVTVGLCSRVHYDEGEDDDFGPPDTRCLDFEKNHELEQYKMVRLFVELSATPGGAYIAHPIELIEGYEDDQPFDPSSDDDILVLYFRESTHFRTQGTGFRWTSKYHCLNVCMCQIDSCNHAHCEGNSFTAEFTGGSAEVKLQLIPRNTANDYYIAHPIRVVASDSESSSAASDRTYFSLSQDLVELQFERKISGTFAFTTRHGPKNLVTGMCSACESCHKVFSSFGDHNLITVKCSLEHREREKAGKITEFYIAHPVEFVRGETREEKPLAVTTNASMANHALYAPQAGQGQALGVDFGGFGFQDDRFGITDANLVFKPPTTDRILDLIRKGLFQGFLITHAHYEHFNSLLLIAEELRENNIPVLMTPLALKIVQNYCEYLLKNGNAQRAKSLLACIRIFKPGDRIQLGDFDIMSFPVAHSIPETCMFLIRFPNGKLVLHVSDWKMNGFDHTDMLRTIMTLRRIREETRPNFLVTDILGINYDGYTPEENGVLEAIRDIMLTTAPGRIIVTCFASNINRIERIIELATIAQFNVEFHGASMRNSARIIEERGVRIKRFDNDKKLLLMTGNQGEEFSALQRYVEADEFDAVAGTARFSFRSSDTVIFSSRAIPGNQHRVRELLEGLLRHGVRCIYLTHQEKLKLGLVAEERVHEAFVHVSGHASLNDITALITEVGPTEKIIAHPEFPRQCGMLNSIIPDGVELMPSPEGVIFYDN